FVFIDCGAYVSPACEAYHLARFQSLAVLRRNDGACHAMLPTRASERRALAPQPCLRAGSDLHRDTCDPADQDRNRPADVRLGAQDDDADREERREGCEERADRAQEFRRIDADIAVLGMKCELRRVDAEI